ncbi:terminase [Mycolicibacterium sp. jd]|uniref:terminase n=1 Tax=unclassified Mycolicibacterium TaxID=2636767 RepID=UPI00351B4316
MAEKVPTPPPGLKASGRRLWQSTVKDFDLDEHELALLREACRSLDSLDALQVAVDQDGVVVESPQGLKAHPALVEVRQQRITFARLVAALGIPAGEEDRAGVQRRAVRGVYGIQGVVS